MPPPRSRTAAPAAPRPPTLLAPSVNISETTDLKGTYPIRVGANSVLHHKAKLNSTLGPITIGEFCIISERANLIAPDEHGLTLENGVNVDIGATVQARRIGENTAVEVYAKVGQRAEVGKNCRFAPYTEVGEDELVADNTVIYGHGERRTDTSGSMVARRYLTERQVEGLRGLLVSARAKFMA